MQSNPATPAAGLFIAGFTAVTAILTAIPLSPILPLQDALAVGVASTVFASLAGLALGWLSRRVGPSTLIGVVGVAAGLTAWLVVLVPTPLNLAAQAGLALLAAAMAAASFAFTQRARGSIDARRPWLGAILAAFVAAVPLPSLMAATGMIPGLPVAAPPRAQITDPHEFIDVSAFVWRPNVYLIGMLAAVPDAIVTRHLGAGPSALNAYLREADFRVFRNAFSETYPTRNSFDLLLALHRDYLSALDGVEAGGLVSGAVPSPLITAFAENGYETSALYEDLKFGPSKGPFVDHYEIAKRASLCADALVPPLTRSLAFFGACQLTRTFPLSLLRPDLDTVFAEHLRRIAEIAGRDRPQLTIMQLRPPLHYGGDKLAEIDHAATSGFAQRYLRSTEQAAANLDRLMSLIRERDPDAIVLVFGDQGLGLSRDLKAAERTPFFVVDRLGVIAAVSPGNVCSDTLPHAESAAAVTTVEIVAGLIGCLAGAPDIYRNPYQHRALVGGETFELAPYVYE